MLSPGNIILFTPFHFKNGAPSKDKFFIVLKIVDGISVMASLPTSVNRAPALIDKPHGCINIDERCYNSYIYQPGKIICETGFSFSLPTFVYGNDIEVYDMQSIFSNYPTEGTQYQIKGTLFDRELAELLDCIKHSGSVRRGVKRMLFS